MPLIATSTRTNQVRPRAQAPPVPATCPRQTEARYLDALRADPRIGAAPDLGDAALYRLHRWRQRPACSRRTASTACCPTSGARLPLEADAEITLEANPGTFETDRFKAFHQAGINRLSIGVQSFDDAKLRALGRVHNRAQAIAAVEEAQRNFETFNLDLMYAPAGPVG